MVFGCINVCFEVFDSCSLLLCQVIAFFWHEPHLFGKNSLGGKYWTYTLKNKGASRCHRRTFLSKWFYKETLTSEHSSDYKKVRKRWFFEEPLTEWFFVEPKMVLLWHRLKNLWSTFIFKSVQNKMWHGYKIKCNFTLMWRNYCEVCLLH